MLFFQTCSSGCSPLPVTPEQRVSAKCWLIAHFVSKGIEVLSIAICVICSWRMPEVVTSEIAAAWALATVISGWLFDALCFEMLARIIGDHEISQWFDLLWKLGILTAFVAFYYFFVFN